MNNSLPGNQTSSLKTCSASAAGERCQGAAGGAGGRPTAGDGEMLQHPQGSDLPATCCPLVTSLNLLGFCSRRMGMIFLFLGLSLSSRWQGREVPPPRGFRGSSRCPSPHLGGPPAVRDPSPFQPRGFLPQLALGQDFGEQPPRPPCSPPGQRCLRRQKLQTMWRGATLSVPAPAHLTVLVTAVPAPSDGSDGSGCWGAQPPRARAANRQRGTAAGAQHPAPARRGSAAPKPAPGPRQVPSGVPAAAGLPAAGLSLPGGPCGGALSQP